MSATGAEAEEERPGLHGLVPLLVLLDVVLAAVSGTAALMAGGSHVFGSELPVDGGGRVVRHPSASHTPFRTALVVAVVLALVVLVLLWLRERRSAAVQGVLLAGVVVAAVLLYPTQPVDPPAPAKRTPYTACYSGGKCYRWDEHGNATELPYN
ncbi:hypothetical protein ACIQBJ_23920 [Kitasatospora sp. NPDC088391]|uniref:hypothetical protein n=1 Tax=Kitasatospora sp. NPDC088391 TaxID=3364074 RepID=UPI0037F7234B